MNYCVKATFLRRICPRPVAEAAILGLYGFAAAALMMSMHLAGW
jgi:succinate-acetate transporter protein